jgi:hypothetical protein
MAVGKIGISTGTFVPLTTYTVKDESKYENKSNGRIFHTIDLNFQKIDPKEYISWCRRNLGDRGSTWDFWMAGGKLYIEVWGEKEKFTYEMWKN